MRQKTTKILYWVFTILLVLGMLFSGISELLQVPSSKEVLTHLGYPLYLNLILGVAKVLGAIVLLQNRFKTLKEWAYAGFSIDFVGAAASLYFSGDGITSVLSVLPFLIVLFVSYSTWKKLN